MQSFVAAWKNSSPPQESRNRRKREEKRKKGPLGAEGLCSLPLRRGEKLVLHLVIMKLVVCDWT